jgi:hypothetical protein
MDNTPINPATGLQFKAEEAIARATVHVTRAATGVVETHELLFFPLPDRSGETPKEA